MYADDTIIDYSDSSTVIIRQVLQKDAKPTGQR